MTRSKRACCESCGRALPAPKRTAAPVDVATLTDAQMFAYYKRTAPEQDLRFLLRFTLSPELRYQIEDALIAPTAADAKRCRELWRIEARARERAAGIPSIGAPIPEAIELEATA
jgi:hypothetical protein